MSHPIVPQKPEANVTLAYEEVSFFRVMKLNKPEWKSITVASICALISGFAMPLLAVIFGDFIDVSNLFVIKFSLSIKYI